MPTISFSSSSNWEPYQFVSCCFSYFPVNCYLCMAFTPSSIDLLPLSFLSPSLLLSLPCFVLPLTAPLHSLLFICARFRRMNWPLLSPGSGREFIFVGQVFQNVIFDRNYPTKWIQAQTLAPLILSSHNIQTQNPCPEASLNDYMINMHRTYFSNCNTIEKCGDIKYDNENKKK